MKRRLLDPKFRYVPAVETDIRKTFARVRREQREAEEARMHEASSKVRTLTPGKKA